VSDLRLALDAERRRNGELEAHAERTQRALRAEAEEQRMRVLFIEKVCASVLHARRARTRSSAPHSAPLAPHLHACTRPASGAGAPTWRMLRGAPSDARARAHVPTTLAGPFSHGRNRTWLLRTTS
jgi:hypothetical protein